MTITVNDCKQLFAGYLINDTIPLRINLPRDLVFQIMDNAEFNTELWKKIINIMWYQFSEDKKQPYHYTKSQSKREAFEKEYEEWRKKTADAKVDAEDLALNDITCFRDILIKSSAKDLPLTLGENTLDFTPKMLLMQNIDLLKKHRAVLFIEDFRKELQTEFDKSLLLKKPTQLLEAYLKIKNKAIDSRLPEYSQENLIRLCIQEGVPVIGCKTAISDDIHYYDPVVLSGNEQKIRQQTFIKKIMRNYEHFKSVSSASQKYPEHRWYISLVRDVHTYSYFKEDSPTDTHPSVIDITGGLYIHAADRTGENNISKDTFSQELRQFTSEKFVNDWEELLDGYFFSNGASTPIENMKSMLLRYRDDNNKPLYTEEIADKIIIDLTKKHFPYLALSPAETNNKLLAPAPLIGKRKAGYVIRAFNPMTLKENEKPKPQPSPTPTENKEPEPQKPPTPPNPSPQETIKNPLPQRKDVAALFAEAIQIATPKDSEKNTRKAQAQTHFVRALESLRDKTLYEVDKGNLDWEKAEQIASSAKELSQEMAMEHPNKNSIDAFSQKTKDLFMKSWSWRAILGAVLGAALGIFFGAMIGMAAGPGAALTAFAGGVKGAIIGATLFGAGGALCGTGLGLLRDKQQDPLAQTEVRASRVAAAAA